MPKIKGIGITLNDKLHLRERDPEDVVVELDVPILLFEEKVNYKVKASHVQTRHHDTEITDSMAHGRVVSFIKDNDYEKVIEVLREKDSSNRYVRAEYYAFNELVQDLYEQDFDMIEILGSLIQEYQLTDPELKQLIGYLVESNKHILREELSDKFKGHTKKEQSLFKFFTVK